MNPEFPPEVLYDEACFLCKNLAHFLSMREGAQRRFVYVPATNRPESVVVRFANGTELVGDAAWTYLLAEEPALKSLSWIAAQLGMTQEAPRVLRRGLGLARRLCISCQR